MIKKDIAIGDILYTPYMDMIIVVTGFGLDKIGQRAIQFRTARKTYHASAWIVFKYFIQLERNPNRL